MDSKNLALITDLRHELHRRPELSLQETKTKETLENFIKAHTELKVVDCGKWFYAFREADGQNKEQGPIAFRADMDALPIPESIDLPYGSIHDGVSHKCGHDGHSAALAGLALALSPKRDGASKGLFSAKPERDVYLIFQHAEEIGRGAEQCAKLIEEKGIEEIYAFHNLSGFEKGAVVLRDGLTQPASKGLKITLVGKTSHASYPEEGRNPSPVLAKLVEAIGRELDIIKAEKDARGMVLCTIVGIKAGSFDYGISAGQGELAVTLRAEKEEEMDRFETMLRDLAGKLAEEAGLEVLYEVSDPFPATINDPVALDKVRLAAKTLGKRVIKMPKLWRASEDFGWYLKRCKGAIFYLGNGEEYPPLHTLEYDFPDENLEAAVDLFTQLLTK